VPIANGIFKKNVYMSGDTIFIDGVIDGELTMFGNSITLGEHAVINGPLSYSSDNDLIITEGASVVGEVTKTRLESHRRFDSVKDFSGWFTNAFFSIWLVVAVVTVLLLNFVFRRHFEAIVQDVRKNFWKRALLGFGSVMLFPFACIILAVSVVGIGLVLFSIPSFVLLIFFGNIIASLVLGTLLYALVSKEDTDSVSLTWQVVVMSVFVYHLISLIPIVGQIVSLVFIAVGIGGVVVAVYNRVKLR